MCANGINGAAGPRFPQADGVPGGRAPEHREEGQPAQRADRLGRQIIQLLHKYDIFKYAALAKGQNVYALIGPSRIGKSVIANDLLNKVLVERVLHENFVIDVAEGQQNVAVIGHGDESKTFFAETFPMQERPDFSIVDCGGFFASQGTADEIAVGLSIKLTFDAASKIKLAICCSYEQFMDDGAHALKELTKIVFKNLLGDIDYKTPVLFVLTKPPLYDNRSRKFLTLQELNERAIKRIEILMPTVPIEDRGIYAHIIRDGGKYLMVYAPRPSSLSDSRGQFLHLMDKMILPEGNASFNAAYSLGAMRELENEMKSIAKTGNILYNKYFGSLKEIEANKKEWENIVAVIEIKKKIDKLRERLQSEKAASLEDESRHITKQMQEKYQPRIADYEKELLEKEKELEKLKNQIAKKENDLDSTQGFPANGNVRIWRKGKGHNRHQKANFTYTGYKIDSLKKIPDAGWTESWSPDRRSYTAHFDRNLKHHSQAPIIEVTVFVKNRENDEFMKALDALKTKPAIRELPIKISELKSKIESEKKQRDQEIVEAIGRKKAELDKKNEEAEQDEKNKAYHLLRELEKSFPELETSKTEAEKHREELEKQKDQQKKDIESQPDLSILLKFFEYFKDFEITEEEGEIKTFIQNHKKYCAGEREG